VSIADATAPPVLDALRSADVQLLQAVFPHTTEATRDLIRACRDRGVSVGVWPMIEDDAGRWASADNGVRYARFARSVLDALGDDAPDTLAIDLEPPIVDVRRILRADPRPLVRRALRPIREEGAHALVELVNEANERGLETFAALVPPLGTGWGGTHGFERAFGSPVSRLRLSRAGPMSYTTLFAGYGRGLIRPRDAQGLLSMLAAGAHRTLGERASLSLGTIGTGALGDERTYTGPDDLAEDVAIARAAGVDDLALFDLGGMLARPPLERWLDVFTSTPAATKLGRPSRRARAIRAALKASGSALSGLASSGRSGRRRDRR